MPTEATGKSPFIRGTKGIPIAGVMIFDFNSEYHQHGGTLVSGGMAFGDGVLFF
jgi:hypothetical protein